VNDTMNIGSMAAILIMTVLIRAQPAAAQGDAEQGRQIGFTCLGCHGIEGQRNAYPSFRVPRLGGQGRDYMRTALRAYREGSRSHPTMHAHASSLTDLDIEDLLAWFDTFAGARDLATAEMVTGADAAAICVSCHGLSGAAVVPQPPILAGQHAEYLEHALNQYKDGKRAGNVMVAFAASLSEADIAAISRFYASQDGLETLAE
jgi:cytochrome c553